MPTAPIELLSEMQRRCLRLVARGRQTKEIAIELGLAPNTVDTYLRQAIRTLGVMTRFEAARLLESNEAEISQDLRYQPPVVANPGASAMHAAPESDANSALSGVVQERHPPFDPKGISRPVRWWRRLPGPWGGQNDLTIRQRLSWIALGTVLILLALFLGLAAVESLQNTLLVLHGRH